MENMILENKEEYERFIKDISVYAVRVEFTILAKDKTPNYRFLEFLEMSLSDPVERTHHKASKKKGIHGSMVYKMPYGDELHALLLSFENIFNLETKIIDENNNKRVFESRVIPTEFGFTDVSFYDASNSKFVYSITHEGELMADVGKYPKFKEYIKKQG